VLEHVAEVADEGSARHPDIVPPARPEYLQAGNVVGEQDREHAVVGVRAHPRLTWLRRRRARRPFVVDGARRQDGVVEPFDEPRLRE
jgi:hypothetical protein